MWILDKAKYKHVSPRLFSGPNIQISSEGFSWLFLKLLLSYPPHCSRQHCLYLGVQQQVGGPQAELCQHPQMSLHLWHLSAGENMKNHTAIVTYKLFFSGAPQKRNKYIEKFALLVHYNTRWFFQANPFAMTTNDCNNMSLTPPILLSKRNGAPNVAAPGFAIFHLVWWNRADFWPGKSDTKQTRQPWSDITYQFPLKILFRK